MKNKYFKKIKVISFFLVLITMIILFFYREKVSRDERFMYEEKIDEANNLLTQAKEVTKIMTEETAKEARAEKFDEEVKKEFKDGDETTREEVIGDAENIGKTVQDETPEADDRAWLAEERQMKVGTIPVRYYIERTQVTIEDTDENIGPTLYYERPVFWVEEGKWEDEIAPETVAINEQLDKKRDKFFDEYKEGFMESSIWGFVGWGMDVLLRDKYYCTTDVTSIYYHEDGILSIGYYYAWYAGGSGHSKYDSINVDWHIGKEISLPEFLNMSNQETKELVTTKALEYKENHPELPWSSEVEDLKKEDAGEFEKMKFYIWEDEVYVLFDAGTLLVPGGMPIKIRIR